MAYSDLVSAGSNPYNSVVVVAWMLLTVAAIGLTLAMLGLTFTCLAFTARNITKIDVMKGKFSLKYNEEKPNPFDLGILSNFATVFEGHLLSLIHI